MGGLIYDRIVTEAEYLKIEEASRDKHEYVAGRLFAMSGCTVAHDLIAGNLHHHIFEAVRRAGCNSFTSDMKVRVADLKNFYYPDLSVTCETLNPLAVFISAPRLLVEVLSPKTMEIDRREKFIVYGTIPTLKEYLLLHQDKREAELYKKDFDGNWQCDIYWGADTILLNSIGNSVVNLALDDVYARTGLV